MLHAPLNEGQGNTLQVEVDGQPRELPLATSASWQPGPADSQALQPQGAACELPDVGDFEKDQPLTCAAWVKLPANDSVGPICARMDDTQGYRGWDFWMQRRQVGMHIIHLWPDNALKVVGQNQLPANQWTHVAVSYDGSGKASGVKVFYDGSQQPVNVEADQLADTIRTAVPLKIGQRQTGQPLSGVALQDLRIYRRALTRGRDRHVGPVRPSCAHPGEAARAAHVVADRSAFRLVVGGGRSQLPDAVSPAGGARA